MVHAADPKRGAHPSAGETSAFTLIELLVVISIIAVLAAILMPAIGLVRAAALGAACANGMRQTGIATYAYASENDGFVLTMGSDGEKWMGLINPYLGADPLATGSLIYRGCPVFRASPRYDPAVIWYAAYAVNPWLWRNEDDPARAWSWDADSPWHRSTGLWDAPGWNSASISFGTLDAPSGRMLFGEPYRGWYVTEMTAGDISPALNHNRRTNVLYCDGHAAAQTMGGAVQSIDAPFR